MNNLNIYNAVREVPNEAKREIYAGRLKGKTDINPMWRIKKLTEIYGPCGIGWKYVITDKRMEQSPTNEIACFLDIDLFVKDNGQWSEAIPGTGGSMFVSQERNGLYTSDECYKMALTDAISVSCKALGFGADVYWDKDKTKYSEKEKPIEPKIESKLEMFKKCLAKYKKLSGLSYEEIYFAIQSETGVNANNIQSIADCEKAIEYITQIANSLKHTKSDQT